MVQVQAHITQTWRKAKDTLFQNAACPDQQLMYQDQANIQCRTKELTQGLPIHSVSEGIKGSWSSNPDLVDTILMTLHRRMPHHLISSVPNQIMIQPQTHLAPVHIKFSNIELRRRLGLWVDHVVEDQLQMYLVLDSILCHQKTKLLSTPCHRERFHSQGPMYLVPDSMNKAAKPARISLPPTYLASEMNPNYPPSHLDLVITIQIIHHPSQLHHHISLVPNQIMIRLPTHLAQVPMKWKSA